NPHWHRHQRSRQQHHCSEVRTMKKLILISLLMVAACAKSNDSQPVVGGPPIPPKPPPPKDGGESKPTPPTPDPNPPPAPPTNPNWPGKPPAPPAPPSTNQPKVQANVVWDCKNKKTGSSVQINGFINDFERRFYLRVKDGAPVLVKSDQYFTADKI